MIKLKDILNEAKRPTRKQMADWIQAFNNSVFKGVKDGYMMFIASDFAVKGMKRILDKKGIDIKSFGGNKYGILVSDKNKFQWNESIEEDSVNERQYSETYFDTFREAAEYAAKIAEKEGYQIDEDDWFRNVATGGRYTRSRPSVGKTHSFHVDLLKRGKPAKKQLHFQVYGMKNKYELNAYVQ